LIFPIAIVQCIIKFKRVRACLDPSRTIPAYAIIRRTICFCKKSIFRTIFLDCAIIGLGGCSSCGCCCCCFAFWYFPLLHTLHICKTKYSWISTVPLKSVAHETLAPLLATSCRFTSSWKVHGGRCIYSFFTWCIIATF